MSCPAPDRVLDYVARRLGSDERDAIDAHVDACDACRALLVELARTDVDAVVAIAKIPDPERIGRYRVEKRLGEGGMGAVFAAYDPQLERRVAIKLVHPELAQRGGIERLLLEGRALAKLSHPNVVAVYDAGVEGEVVYVAMELVEGDTLAAWLQAAPRTWRDIIAKVLAAARGIAAAHRAGIIHRDIKPDNVLIDREGHTKVADFGLAGDSQSLSQRGTIAGTPMYMSPEQRRGGEIGPASDQYNLCATVDGPLRAAPRWVRRAIERGLAPDPADRFASMDALIAALDPARRARRTWAIAGALVAIAASAGVYAATRRSDPTGDACAASAAARQQLVRRAAGVGPVLRATGAPHVGETAPRVEHAIAQYFEALAEAETTWCGATPRSENARTELADALACIATHRDEVATLLGRLEHIAATDVRYAVSLVHALSPIEECTNPVHETFVHGIVGPHVRAELHAAHEASGTGDFRGQLAHAQRAVALARRLGGISLPGALLALGDAAMLTEGFPAAEAAYREAITTAEAANADDLRALAMAELMMAMARQPPHEQEALAFAPLVEAAIARVGQRTAYTPIVQQARGIADLQLGKVDEGIASLEAALATARSVLPKDDPRMPEYIYPVGVAYSRNGNAEKALRYQEEAFRVASEIWGASHPSTQRFAINLAIEHAALGQNDVAIRELLQARTALTGLLGDDSPELLQIAQTLGACYFMKNAFDDAEREYTLRQHALMTAGRAKSAEMAASWVDLGDVFYGRKVYTTAATHYQHSLDDWEALVGKTDPRLTGALSRLGEAELSAGRPERAVAPLERALAIATGVHAPAYFMATVQFPLARALWPRDRARAHALAIAARDAFAASGKMGERQRPDVERWLAEHR